MDRNGRVDLILTGGRVWTGNSDRPYAGAVAIGGDRIAAVGPYADILALRTRSTEVIDLRGRYVIPGFNDAHVHFSTGGFSLTSVQLRGCRNEAEFRSAIGEFAQAHPDEWILHGEWDPERWPSGELPTAQLIDDVTPHNPVFVRRIDAHTWLANSLAMELAGVNKETPDVPGGVIVRYADGSPTGIFKDAAQRLIQSAVPPPSFCDILNAIDAAQRHAAAHGVTSVHDMGIVGGSSDEHAAVFRAYQALQRRHGLHVGVSFHMPLIFWQDLAQVGITQGFGNAQLRIGALKGFADGSLGSGTACFMEAYTDAPQTKGIYSHEMQNQTTMYDALQQADASGLQLAMHAIGDRANSDVLDLFEVLIRENGRRDRRLRIEHAQHLLGSDFRRFAHLGVVASVQPYHAIDDGCWLEQRIGTERAARSYAFRSLLDAGAIVAIGSDWPVETIDPFKILYAAVTRRTLDGKHPGGWIPEQKISLIEALRAYTMGSAYASHQEHVRGTIESGKLADLVAVPEDIFSMEPARIDAIPVDMTISNGEVVYDALPTP